MGTIKDTDGIFLGTNARWAISGIVDYEPFLRHLSHLISASNAVVYLEGTSIAPDVRQFYERHAVAPWHQVYRGTIFPEPSVFHLPATPDVLTGLADLAALHAPPELADHCHVYTKCGMILQWYDACDPDCPIGVAPEITENKLRVFCDQTGSTFYRYELPGATG